MYAVQKDYLLSKNVNIKNQKIKNQNIGTIWYLGEYARRNVLFPLTLHQSLHGKLACIPESSWNLIHVHIVRVAMFM